MKAFIKGAAVISPQKTFDQEAFPDEFLYFSGVTALKCAEPAYRDFIDPMISRRMSRIVKMGVCGALKCIRNTGISMPDGIIAGTGLGCLEDTGRFLSSIYANEEKLLNPTPFIQSTHNTVAGAIALAIKCHGYNATYTHRGFSFESALEDALLQLAESPDLNILTGGFDELTDDSLQLTSRLGLWKNRPVNSDQLSDNSRGSLPGEGVAFFMLSGVKGENDKACLQGLKIFFQPEGDNDIKKNITDFLLQQKTDKDSIDLVLLGINGDEKTDRIYFELMNNLFSGIPCADFKYLCGEYDTASSFALWLSLTTINQQQFPVRLLQGILPKNINRILIYNHLRGINHALLLIERC